MPSTPELPEDDAARLREALSRAMYPNLAQIQRAMARMQDEQRAQLCLAAAPLARFQEQWRRYVRDVLTPAEQARQDAVRQAMEQWNHGLRRALVTAQERNLAAARAIAQGAVLDSSPLNQVLRDMQTWQALTAAQRAQAVTTAEEAYAATSEDDVTDEMVEEMEETVRRFAASPEAEFVPLEVRAQSFALFVAAVVLSSLMVLAFTSDTADAVMAKAIELSALAGVSMVVAKKAWQRYMVDGDEGEQARED
ncbi:hypothetical protein [Streptomyces longwoodensis]|uniref:hypothetical protein n=1 Tax=Streptomyces longwoodensis TaxID=68231 RepID=UPI00225191A4|nr:hypothetical protein [Streptomyces longwoodensis]MCX5000955.1 hypothetical protein [Streptomyces longwoodensis]